MTSLPLFPDRLDEKLANKLDPLCTHLTEDEIIDLRIPVQKHVDTVQKALDKNEFLDIATAARIAEALVKLLSELQQFTDNHQKLIIGAARYFVQSGDLEPDTISILGFDDDLQVLNYVLKRVGRYDLLVEF